MPEGWSNTNKGSVYYRQCWQVTGGLWKRKSIYSCMVRSLKYRESRKEKVTSRCLLFAEIQLRSRNDPHLSLNCFLPPGIGEWFSSDSGKGDEQHRVWYSAGLGNAGALSYPWGAFPPLQELSLLWAGDGNLAALFDYDPYPSKWKNDKQRVLFTHNLEGSVKSGVTSLVK